MGSWIAALAAAYAAVFLLELPDKTTALTLVLTTRYRAPHVLAGSALAFAVQAAVAVAFGSAIALLPGRLVAAAMALLFGASAIMLLREGFAGDVSDRADGAGPQRPAATGTRAVLTSFATLFLAEWGDASQLAAVGVAARYAQPAAVALGTFLALMSVTALAMFVGHKLRSRVPAHWIQRGAGFVFATLCLLALGQLVLG